MSLKISQEFQQTLAENPILELDEPHNAPEAPVIPTEPIAVSETPPAPVPEPVIPEATPAVIVPDPVIPAQAEPVAEPLAQPSFEQLLEERSGGRFKSFDDVLAREQELELAKPQAQGEELFADETIKLVNGFVKLGKGTFNEAVSLITKDFTKLDGLDVLREYSALKEPFLTPEQREFAIQEVADSLNPELNGERDVQKAVIAFQREVNQKRSELSQQQQQTIEGLRNEIATDVPEQAPQRDYAAIQAAWNNKVDNDLLSTVSELTHTAKDGTVFKFGVDDNAKAAARNDMYNIDRFSDRYSVKQPDGSFKHDLDKFRDDMLWLNNREAIIEAVSLQARSGGVKSLLNEVVNAPQVLPPNAPSANPTAPSDDPLRQAAKLMLGRR